MPHAEYPDLAHVAYDAYAQATLGPKYEGQPLPQMEDLGERTQAAWQAAVQAVVDTVREYDQRDAGVMLTAPAHRPIVGRIILVLADPSTNNGADIAAAVITRVWNDNTINARVLLDSDAIQWRTSITRVDDLADVAPDDIARLSRWAWPPCV